MRIYLAQHGLAMAREQDPTRPLSAQGREDVTRCAGFLSLFEKPRPVRIMHSGKLRAEQTARMFAEAWGVAHVCAVPGLAPKDDPHPWRARLQDMREDVMLVGHLPFLQRLLGLLLCGNDAHDPVRMRPGGVLCLERSKDVWQLLWYIYPALFYGEDD
ncbi:MAG: phosphohistidine phosphatase SixA [Zetaproteobacteria bacterium]|nr:MAG: phosphohistidine phosphatase SixA [Zetaproteobacteria bacterium]